MSTGKAFVTGCAGFLGSHLCDRLLAEGYEVVGFDNFSTGQKEFLKIASENGRFRWVEGDAVDSDKLKIAMKGCDAVFHLAANADVRFGTQNPRRDLDQNTVATFNVLEAMRANKIRRMLFTSTGSVYGNTAAHPTPEDASFPVQTSFYAASKLGAEGFIEAFSEAFDIEATVLRLVSVLGERYSHGHVFDFYQQLLEHPERLDVLGNGKQRKSYLYIQDLLDGMFLAFRAPGRFKRLNIGTEESCTVDESIGWIAKHLGLKPSLKHSGGERGWVGDNPFILLDISKIKKIGFKPKVSIQDAVVRTVRYLEKNQWLLKKRDKSI